jgi:hypothetical protein
MRELLAVVFALACAPTLSDSAGQPDTLPMLRQQPMES